MSAEPAMPTVGRGPGNSGAVFDQLAPNYDTVWTNSIRGRAQRGAVWHEIDGLFHVGDRVLDLGCGTGEDALHLESAGVSVHSIDASPEMVRKANARGVSAQLFKIEDLSELEGSYHGAISNFGALNCVQDLRAAGIQLARLICPRGPLAITIMPPLCWNELFRFEFRRLRRRTEWRGISVYYPSTRRLVSAFPDFELLRRRSLAWGDHRFFLFRRK